jgi:hypothetical protein
MTRVQLRRVKPQAPYFSAIHNRCVGCHGCGHSVAGSSGQRGLVSLPGVKSDTATMELTLSIQSLILWNSWMKPLLLVVLASVICSLAGVTEVWAIVATLCAFLAGLARCKAQPSRVLIVSGNI